MASRSRWLVGSSSSNRSEGHISACARFSRMRQPPEKLATGSPICSCVKPRPCRSCSARERTVYASASPIAACSSPIRWPSFVTSQRGVAVDRVLERGTLERRRFLRDVRDAPARRVIDLALVGVKLAAQEREQARLPRAVRADQADLVARVERDVGAFEQRLGAAAERDLGEADHGVLFRKARIVRDRGPIEDAPGAGSGLSSTIVCASVAPAPAWA